MAYLNTNRVKFLQRPNNWLLVLHSLYILEVFNKMAMDWKTHSLGRQAGWALGLWLTNKAPFLFVDKSVNWSWSCGPLWVTHATSTTNAFYHERRVGRLKPKLRPTLSIFSLWYLRKMLWSQGSLQAHT